MRNAVRSFMLIAPPAFMQKLATWLRSPNADRFQRAQHLLLLRCYSHEGEAVYDSARSCGKVSNGWLQGKDHCVLFIVWYESKVNSQDSRERPAIRPLHT